jgi:hypothetical protein
VIKTESYIKWEGRQYFEALELGFADRGGFIVSVFTTPPDQHRGRLFTIVPISDAKYRARNKGSRAAVLDEGSELIIYCDWGRSHRLGASRAVIEQLLADAAAHEIPIRAAAETSRAKGGSE